MTHITATITDNEISTSILEQPITANITQQVIEVEINNGFPGGSGVGAWGEITGTLSDQTDLQDALDLKANLAALATVAITGDYNDLINVPNIIDFALLADTVYVGKTATVDGTRTGQEELPFSSFADAIAFWGEPTTQAEYTLPKRIVCLDNVDYAENFTLPMGNWIIEYRGATQTGNITWEIDSALRFGSTVAPRLDIVKDAKNILVGLTGDINVQLKSGGSAVSTLYFNTSGFIQNGNITIADGTNIGASCASLPVVSGYRGTLNGSFKNRLCFASFTQFNLSNTLAAHEFGLVLGVQNLQILGTSVMEARVNTGVRTIRGLILANNTVWDTNGDRNWNVDVTSATEVLTKIISYPDGNIELLTPIAEAMSIVDLGDYYISRNVEDALQEIGSTFSTLSSFYLPLDGSSPMEGDLDMDGFDIDNIKQAINDGATEANPAFLTGDSGWYGTNAKTMYLSISGSTVARLNINGYDIIDNDAMFGDVEQNDTGLGVNISQSTGSMQLGDWRGTVGETYIDIDPSTGFIRKYVNGVQVMDVQANSVEVNRPIKYGGVVDVNTSTYNVVGNESLIRVFYTATGVCTLQLPVITAAMDGVVIPIIDFGMNAGTNKIVLNRGGTNTIEGSATSYEFVNDGESHGLLMDFANGNFKIV